MVGCETRRCHEWRVREGHTLSYGHIFGVYINCIRSICLYIFGMYIHISAFILCHSWKKNKIKLYFTDIGVSESLQSMGFLPDEQAKGHAYTIDDHRHTSSPCHR